MANGYIGKISAVVTANTSDLSRKLQGAVKDVDRFANSLNRSVSASAQQATASLEKIFTPLQRLERKLQTALQLNLRTDDEVRKIQQLVGVAEGINKPLERAAGSFSKLSLEVQGSFLPALNRAQDAATNLSNTLQQQGSVSANSFKQVEQVVNRTAQAIQRLTQAQQLASQSLSGNELQFGNPRLFEALSSNARITQQAGALPDSALVDGDIARQIRALEQYRGAALEADARVSALRLDPTVNPEVLIAAERRLESLVETYSRAGAQLSRAIQVRIDVQDAEARISRLRGIADAALRGIPSSVAAIDAEFADLAARVESLGLEDRANLDQLINDFIKSAEAADPLIAQFEKILRLRREIDGIESEPGRIARANELLTIDTAESDRLSRESGLERSAGASTRLIDRVGPSVTALRGQLDGLAEPLRASVGPEVDRVTNKFRLLSRDGVAQSAEAVQRLKGEIAGLNAALESRRSIGRDFLQSFGGSGTAGLGLGVDQRSLRAIGAEIEFVQTRLASLGQQARGPVLAALEALRVAANRLFQDGAIDTDEGRAELEGLRQDLIRVAATAENVKPDQFGAALKRAGDIARGSFGNVGLAVQQAAFAFEDFFSVTGGLDQRIRAAGNNLSQLGFILGSTKGLIAGIVIGVGAQFAAMLIKWANNGKTAEDQTRALNEALSRQKSIAEDIARAFESLAETFSRGIFSEAGEQARQLSSRLEEIARRQRELRDSGVAALDPAVQRERTTQATLQRQLEAEPNAGRRVAIEREIARSRGREQEAARAAAAAAGPTVDEATQAIRRAADREFAVRTRGDDTVTAADARILEDARGRTAAAAGAAPAELQRILQQQLDSLTRSGAVAVDAAAADSAAELGRLIAGLQRRIAEVTDEQVVALFESIDQPAQRIRQAQDTIAQALAAGIPGARELATAVDAASTELTAAGQRINDRLNANQPVDQGLADAARQQRDAAVKAFEAEQQKVRAIELARQALDRFADALSRAGDEAQRNLSSAQSAADEARQADLGLSTPQSRERRQRAEADLRRQQELTPRVQEEIAAATERFRGDAANVRRLQLARESDLLGDQFNQLVKEAGLPFTGDRRRSIEALTAGGFDESAEEARQINERLSQARAELGLRGEDFWAGVRAIIERGASGVSEELVNAADRIAEIDRLLSTQGVLGGGQREELVRERARIEQQAVEADEAVRRARDESTAEDQRRQAAARGAELSQTPAQRAGESLARQLDDLRQFFGRQAEEGTGLVDFEAQNAATARVFDDAARGFAPALFALQDAVANAVLQGPSRAALQATDASTVEGARELNRLLRGEDSARDQNLVELQKQSQSLEELVRIAREGGADIAD